MEKVSLHEFSEIAYRAFYWTSFDAKKRAEQTISEHENELNNDLQNIPESEHERYIQSYKRYFAEWLHAHANCASSAITGGSKFNVERAEKANRREHAKYEQFMQWRERALKAIDRKVKDENKQIDERENIVVEFEGGKIVQNFAENRLQIIFDEKPNREIIDLLKKNAFRWSPRFGAWQRQNTNNAIAVAKKVLEQIKNLEQ